MSRQRRKGWRSSSDWLGVLRRFSIKGYCRLYSSSEKGEWRKCGDEGRKLVPLNGVKGEGLSWERCLCGVEGELNRGRHHNMCISDAAKTSQWRTRGFYVNVPVTNRGKNVLWQVNYHEWHDFGLNHIKHLLFTYIEVLSWQCVESSWRHRWVSSHVYSYVKGTKWYWRHCIARNTSMPLS